MISLEDAITHCLEVADGQTAQGKCPECAMEHRQLAEWLKELKHYRERMSYDDEVIAPKSITTAFQFGMAFGFAKKYDEMDKVMEEVKKAVTPQAMPKMGHWITKDSQEHGFDIGGVKTWYIQIMCSECGFIKTAIEGHTGQYHYCPNCGAKMQEGKNEYNRIC